jgi:hypothetical protein
MTTDNPQTSPRAGTENEQPDTGQGQEMCCDGQQTAEEHRHKSPDGKCCIDD